MLSFSPGEPCCCARFSAWSAATPPPKTFSRKPTCFQTARNLALDYLRARRVHARTIIDDAPLSDIHNVVGPDTSLEDAAHANRLLESLSASLETLSPRQQKIFNLSRLHGASYLEIAEQLGVSTSTVQKELKLIMRVCLSVAARLDH
jgi:RNA polymerase sigma factor (sigma-70 family)